MPPLPLPRLLLPPPSPAAAAAAAAAATAAAAILMRGISTTTTTTAAATTAALTTAAAAAAASPTAPAVSWFPGHMHAALGELARIARSADLVIEVRDARVPLSSANPRLEALLSGGGGGGGGGGAGARGGRGGAAAAAAGGSSSKGARRAITVLNKADLVSPRDRQAALRAVRAELASAAAARHHNNHHAQQQPPPPPAKPPRPVLAVSSRSRDSAARLLDAAVGWLAEERAASRLSIVLVVGLPNSGKSSLIDALRLAAASRGALAGDDQGRGGGGGGRRHRRPRVGDTPGLTRQVAGFRVCDAPLTYVLDSPGIMVPRAATREAGMRLALAGAVRDAVVGEEALVRWYVALLARRPRLRAALRRAADAGGGGEGGGEMEEEEGQGGGSRSGRGSRQRGSTGSRRSGGNEAQQLARMRAALLEASAPLGGGSSGGGGGSGSGAFHWHPGIADGGAGAAGEGGLPPALAAAAAAAADADAAAAEDAADADADAALRYERLLRALGVADGAPPTAELGACVRLLKALRAGQLGRCVLDDVW